MQTLRTLTDGDEVMTETRQFWVLVRYKDEPGSGFGKQYVTATNAYEAIQMAKALYGRLLISEGVSVFTP